jgi:hypothetical protein
VRRLTIDGIPSEKGEGRERKPSRTKGLTLHGKPFRERKHGQKRRSLKVCKVVVSASPARMVKLKTEPVAKRKPNLCPTRCIPPSTVAYLEKEPSLEPVTPQYAAIALGCAKLSEVSGPQ